MTKLLLLGCGKAGASVSAPLWTPDELGNAVIWLKGGDLTGVDTDPIATWEDASGNNNDATQSGGTKPTVDATGLNGMKVALFVEASTQYMDMPNVFTGLTQASQFFVTRTTDVSPSQGPVSKMGSQVSTNENNHYTTGGNVVHDDFGSTVRKDATAITNPSSWHIGNFNSQASDWTYFKDGVSEFSTATNTVGWRTTPKLGRGTRPGLENHYGGRLAEFIVFSEYLSQTNREKVEGYLAHRWGIASVLDAGHPYKSSAPTI